MPEHAVIHSNTKRVDVLEAYKLKTISHLTYKQIGQLQGVHPSAVHAALQSFLHSLPSDDQLQGYDTARASLMNAASQRLLASCLDEEKIQKATLRESAVAFGIIYDKHRLETAQSTSNISVLSKLISQADSGLFKTQAGSQAAPCLDETHATVETSTKDIKGL